MALLNDRYLDDGIPAIELSDIQKVYISKYKKKCADGVYSFRDLKCECGNCDFEEIAQKDRYGLPVTTVICRKCGLIVTSPCLDDKSNSEFYDNEYHYIYRSEDKPSDDNFYNRKAEAKNIIDFIRRHTGIIEGSVLEIGCADGGNVAAFSDSGYKASGIDLSHTYIEFGKKKGLDLYCCDSASFCTRGLTFNIIVLNHVLEHFTNIGDDLTTIKKMLKPEGILFVAVPGVKYLTYGAYDADFLLMLQNAHIYNFTKTSLCNVMGKYGFQCIFANEFIYSVFRNGSTDTGATDVYDDTMDYLHNLEDASGDIRALVFYRISHILSGYEQGEVLLYGTAAELDNLVQNLNNLESIRGFFYSDSKTPDDVCDYILSSVLNPPVKCLILADAKQNDHLCRLFDDKIQKAGIDLYSIYSEIF